MIDPETYEAIDACRPGSDDLQQQLDPELRKNITQDSAATDQYQATQHSDRLIQQALQDVEVPADLQASLLSSLSQFAPANASAAGEQIQRSTRRRWLATALGLCCVAASLAVAFALGVYPNGNQQLCRNVKQWAAELPSDGWQKLPTSGRVREIFTQSGLQCWPRHYQSIETQISVDTVAYELPAAGSAKAYLFAVSSDRTGLPKKPTATPNYDTGGWRITTWHANGHLYALVVHGSAEVYRNVVGKRESLASFKAPIPSDELSRHQPVNPAQSQWLRAEEFRFQKKA